VNYRSDHSGRERWRTWIRRCTPRHRSRLSARPLRSRLGSRHVRVRLLHVTEPATGSSSDPPRVAHRSDPPGPWRIERHPPSQMGPLYRTFTEMVDSTAPNRARGGGAGPYENIKRSLVMRGADGSTFSMSRLRSQRSISRAATARTRIAGEGSSSIRWSVALVLLVASCPLSLTGDPCSQRRWRLFRSTQRRRVSGDCRRGDQSPARRVRSHLPCRTHRRATGWKLME